MENIINFTDHLIFILASMIYSQVQHEIGGLQEICIRHVKHPEEDVLKYCIVESILWEPQTCRKSGNLLLVSGDAENGFLAFFFF